MKTFLPRPSGKLCIKSHTIGKEDCIATGNIRPI